MDRSQKFIVFLAASCSLSLFLIGVFIGQTWFSIHQLPVSQSEAVSRISSVLTLSSELLHETYARQLNDKLVELEKSLSASVARNFEKVEQDLKHRLTSSASEAEKRIESAVLKASEELKNQLSLQGSTIRREEEAFASRLRLLATELSRDMVRYNSERSEADRSIRKLIDASVIQMKAAAFRAVDHFLRGSGIKTTNPEESRELKDLPTDFNPFF